jgi:hypothetical protein
MSKRLYTAAVMQLRAKALEELAIIERLLGDPRTTSEELIVHARELVLNENAITALEGYVGPQYDPPPQLPPQPPVAEVPETAEEEVPPEPLVPTKAEDPPAQSAPSSESPIVVTPEMSPTYAKSVGKSGEMIQKLVGNKPKKEKKKKKKAKKKND